MTTSKKQIIISIFTLSVVLAIAVALFLSQQRQRNRSKTNETIGTPTLTKSLLRALSSDPCESANISGNVLSPGGSLTITAKAKNNNFKSFLYAFSNRDNRRADKNNSPKFIKFSPDTTFYSIASDTNTLSISFDDVNKPDLNWENQYPKHIQVNVYFVNNLGFYSFTNPKCQVSFDVGS